MDNIDFKSVRGLDGVKDASVEINGIKLNIAAVNGLSNMSKILDDIRNGENPIPFY